MCVSVKVCLCEREGEREEIEDERERVREKLRGYRSIREMGGYVARWMGLWSGRVYPWMLLAVQCTPFFQVFAR